MWSPDWVTSEEVSPRPFIAEFSLPIQRELEAEYDGLADEYDATRVSATRVEVSALANALEGCKTVLDLGSVQAGSQSLSLNLGSMSPAWMSPEGCS